MSILEPEKQRRRSTEIGSRLMDSMCMPELTFNVRQSTPRSVPKQPSWADRPPEIQIKGLCKPPF
jgi:hypothetical protein